MKVALVYDRINKFGGAERVLLALHKLFPNAPLYTSVYDPQKAPWAKVFEIRTSFLQKLPIPKSAHEYYPFLMGFAFESFNFDEFDLVISVTHEFAKGIITKPNTKHICYCLNPVGYLWDSHDDYFYSKPQWFKKITKPLILGMRFYDKHISHRPDEYLTISKTVQERIKRIYGRESEVIYPPVQFPNSKHQTPTDNFFLIVSRLVPQKRIDIAVKAFNKLGLPLKIIGTGKEFKSLKNLSKKNIEFLGHLSDDEVSKYYLSCRAVIIPGEEDFNLVAVETQSFGKPVIAYGRGGVTETVKSGQTGWFFEKQTAKVLAETIKKVLPSIHRIKPSDCKKQANKFSGDIFEKRFLDYVRFC